MHPTPLQRASHARCLGARMMPGIMPHRIKGVNRGARILKLGGARVEC
jgi:hypothetical protein